VPDSDDQDRREFRAWVRAHHPDRGGDPESFVAGLVAWRQRRRPARNVGAARADVTVFRTQHGLWRLRRWWQRHRGPRRVR
jgi:hypothetical protein